MIIPTIGECINMANYFLFLDELKSNDIYTNFCMFFADSLIIKEELVPPNPKELLNTVLRVVSIVVVARRSFSE